MGRIQRDDNKFTWVIKDFSISKDLIRSDVFVIGGCKWRLMACPVGFWAKTYMSLYVDVADTTYLPFGWSRQTKLQVNVVNQRSNQSSHQKSKHKWFDEKSPTCGFVDMIPHCRLFDEEGFVVNGQVVIVAAIDVIGKVDDVVEESEAGSSPLKKIKLSDDGAKSNDLLNKTQQVKESMDVNGFQVLPSQVEFVRRIFEKHPDMAQGFRAKSQHLRTASMTVLLSLIGTLCQSPQELSNEDLVEGGNALGYVKYAGFKVDWLEKKLKEVKAKKEEEQTGETRIQELEKEIKNTEQKLSDMTALLEKEKAKVLAARVSLTLDDFI